MSDLNQTPEHEALRQIQNSQALILDQLGQLNRSLNQKGFASRIRQDVRPLLKCFITKTNNGRKPYILTTDGVFASQQKLTPIRTAIILVLILDLQERSYGGTGLVNPDHHLREFLLRLSDSQISEPGIEERLRVALYRFNDHYRSDPCFLNKQRQLKFNPERRRFDLFEDDQLKNANTIQIELGTDHPDIAEIIDRTTTSSPLTLIRQRKALFVPAGPHSYDRLLFELFDHKMPISVTTTSPRLSTTSYPLELLKRATSSDMAIKRKQLADLSRKSGKFKYLEIVALDGLQALTKCSPDGDMLAYPKGITRDDLRSHIHYLIDTLNLNDNYELVVTNAPFTFYVGNYVIHQEKIPEPITVFFGEFSSNYLHDSSCFAVNDPFVCQSVSGNIINWILNHPETTRNKQNVVAVLERMLITL